MPTQLAEATRTARKAHRCGMCRATIAVGEKHHISTHVYDGRVYDFRTCRPCEDDGICAEVYAWAWSPCEGVTDEDAWEWAHEHRDESEAARRYLERNGCSCERCEAAS